MNSGQIHGLNAKFAAAPGKETAHRALLATEMGGYLLNCSKCNLDKGFGVKSAKYFSGTDGSNEAPPFYIRDFTQKVEGLGFDSLKHVGGKRRPILLIDPFPIFRAECDERIFPGYRQTIMGVAHAASFG
ncbi:MAG: hypothetical protein WCK00_06420, partial [Deltaproteobacteria bacterium]